MISSLQLTYANPDTFVKVARRRPFLIAKLVPCRGVNYVILFLPHILAFSCVGELQSFW